MISDKRIALLVLCCVFVSGDGKVSCIESEREALLSFKHGLIDENDVLTLWQSEECCEWYGVECSSTTGHVITLKLSNATLRGSIPQSIGQLSELQVLDLSHNSLEGLVHESHFIKLDKLSTLDFSFNSVLIFDVPLHWSPPFQLKTISLAGCNMGPYFPKWIQTQRNLSFLDLSSANIADEAPMWLWHSSSLLRNLYLYNNQISGTIPNLSSTSIEFMDLSYNHFSGPIPLFPANAYVIYLSGNMFTGSISSICKTHHNQLRYLLISDNQLSGDLPNCWENMPNLHTLHLVNNRFSGEIPASFGSLQNFVALHMHGNNLSGELPYNLSRCQELRFLDVGGNNLNGVIPTWIGQMYNMQFIILRGNKLHGSIPIEICHLTDIQVLDLSLNNLSSSIPGCFNNFTLLASKNSTSLDMPCFGSIQFAHSSFQWKGHVLEYTKNLGLLKLMDFSSNTLTGNIPKSFAHLRGLKSLNLSRNSLTGLIIPDIGKLEMLDSLDLSHNQLSGKIPTSLAEIYSLGVLDLSHNNFSGKVPTGTQLQSFGASSYAQNHELCGDPLPKCPVNRPSTTNLGANMNEKDNINFSFMEEVGISMGFGFIFGFWGVVGSFIFKKSWRIAFFNLSDAAGDWFYDKIFMFVSKWRRS